METIYQTVIHLALILLVGYSIHTQDQAIKAMTEMNNKLHMTFIRS
jgi:hypothetical protein